MHVINMLGSHAMFYQGLVDTINSRCKTRAYGGCYWYEVQPSKDFFLPLSQSQGKHESTTIPPPQLCFEDLKPNIRAAKPPSKTGSTPAPPLEALSPPLAPQTQLPTGGVNTIHTVNPALAPTTQVNLPEPLVHPHAREMPQATGYMPYQPPTYNGYYPPPQTPRRFPYYQPLPSSEPEFDDPTIFPRVSKWLGELDAGVRGSDGHNFSQFVRTFEEAMYTRISQVQALTRDDLVKLNPAMPPGTADLIIFYANKDCQDIKKKEIRRLKEVQLQPVHYT